MKKIFKFKLRTTEVQVIRMPENSEILCVQTQFNNPCLWVLFDEDSENDFEVRQFKIFGTGHLIESTDILKYIGTYQVHDGSGVFHLFEDLTPF